MKDYSDIGLTDRLQSVNSILAKQEPQVTSLDFESQYDRGLVTTAKVQNKSVVAAKIADGAVGTAQLVDLSVTTAKLAAAAVVTSKMATVSVDSTILADLAVTAGKLAGSAVIAGKIGTSAISTTEIADAAITSAKIGSAAVGAAAIAAAAIGSAAIGTSVISTAHIADLAVTNAKINDVSFNKATGGTLVLGGTNNVSGVFSLRNPAGSEVIGMNNNGITVTNGSITIQNSSGSNVLDNMGIVSQVNFNSGVLTITPNSTTTGTTYVDVTNGTIGTALVLSRVTRAYIFLEAYHSNTSLLDNVTNQVTTGLRVGTLEYLYLSTPGILVNNGTTAVIQDNDMYTAGILDLNAGTYAFKASYKVEVGGTAHLYSVSFGYVLLGN